MTFDFTSVIDRQGKDALAVEGVGWGFAPSAPQDGFDFIPLWVADMNFATAPSIPEAIRARAAHPLYGYFLPSEAYHQAIIGWQKTRFGTEGLTPEQISYHNGVLGGVASALKAFTIPGEKIFLHSPTYIGFTHVLENTGRTACLSPLKQDAEGVWRMDLDDMERRLEEERIHFAIFCSPHNPTGRVWEREELEAAMALFAKYDCTVVCDEIWSDLTLPGYTHIPLQQTGEEAKKRVIAFYSPSKGFNLSGLGGSYGIVYNETLRDKLRAAADSSHYNGLNVLSMHALIGAYSETGAAWLDALREVLNENTAEAVRFLNGIPGIQVSRPQGTYLLFVNCRGYCEKTGRSMDEILSACWDKGVGLQDGRPFHDPYALRINTALPKERLSEAFRRLKEYIFV